MTTQSPSTLSPQRAIDDLKELRSLTGNADGAQRVAWTDTWAKARAWMREKLSKLPVELEIDEAGNSWATLRGKSDREMLIGGDIYSGPNGGWVRRCLDAVAGVGVVRRVPREGAPPATARLAGWGREIAKRNGGVCTVGSVITKPGIVTAVVGQCDITLDQRHLNADSLAKMLQEAKDASQRFAKEENVDVEWRRIWQIHPILFNPELVELCEQAIKETAGISHRLPSGPLHDAAEVARANVPTIMMFVQSLRGLSHAKEEDTKEEHLAMCVQALDRLAGKTMNWIVEKGK